MSELEAANRPVFGGKFQYALDKQRRIPLPAGWRRELGDATSLLMVPRENMQIEVMTEELFHERMVPFAARLGLRERARLGALMHRSPLDKQGRITVSTQLLELIKVEEQVVLIGSVQSILLMNPATWTMADDSIESIMFGYGQLEAGGQFG